MNFKEFVLTVFLFIFGTFSLAENSLDSFKSAASQMWLIILSFFRCEIYSDCWPIGSNYRIDRSKGDRLVTPPFEFDRWQRASIFFYSTST